MYKQVEADNQAHKNNNWYSVFSLMGLGHGRNQKLIQELLQGNEDQDVKLEWILKKFTRGERLSQDDLKKQASSNRSSRRASAAFASSNRNRASVIQPGDSSPNSILRVNNMTKSTSQKSLKNSYYSGP